MKELRRKSVQDYESPMVKVIKVEIEKGFASSGVIGGNGADYPLHKGSRGWYTPED